MAKYHINPENGNFGVCESTKGKCPFGGESGQDNHFTDKKEAYNASMAVLASKYGSFSTLDQNDRLEAAVFSDEIAVSEKRSLLKEHLDNNFEDVEFMLQDYSVMDDATDPYSRLEDTSEEELAEAIAEVKSYNNGSIAEVIPVLEERARADEARKQLKGYMKQMSKEELSEVLDEAYGDDPHKRIMMEREING